MLDMGEAFGQETPVRVLHLDDSVRDAELIRERVAGEDAQWRFTHVQTREAFEAALADERFDLILTDFSIPGYDGMEAVRAAHAAQPDVPIVVISGTLSEEAAVACLKAGATDYIIKQRLQRLGPAVRRALAEAREREMRFAAERRMQELSQNLRAMAEHSRDVFWIMDLDPPRFSFLSPSVERIRGVPPEALLKDPRAWITGVHPEDRSRVIAALEAFAKADDPRWEEEYRVVHVDGSVRWILSSGTRTEDHRSGTRRLSGVATEITERKLAEMEILRLNASLEAKVEQRTQALAVETEKLRAVLDTAGDAIVALDERGVVLSFNRAAERLTGYTAAEMVGANVTKLMAESDAHAHRAGLEAYLRSSAPRPIAGPREVLVRRSDGSTFPARLSIGEGRGAEGARFFTGILSDITERKERERRILELNADLERRMVEVQVANRELEAFSYSVSHDLRAPLHAVIGFAQALRSERADRLDERGLHYLGRIDTAAQRMDGLIDAMLDLARLSRAELVPMGVDLTAMANELLEELRQEDPDRKTRLAIAPGMRAYADRNLLRIALENLLRNAWKFSRDRDETFVEVGQIDDQPDSCTFYVRDRGAGFPAEHAHKLFGTFQRLHTASEFPGTGIGLATVRRVVERHGGRAWAEGAVGEGATFYFSLPRPRGDPGRG